MVAPSSPVPSSLKTKKTSALKPTSPVKKDKLFIVLPIPEYLGHKEAYTREDLQSRLNFATDALLDYRDKMLPRLFVSYTRYHNALRLILDDAFEFPSQCDQAKAWCTIISFDKGVQDEDMQPPQTNLEYHIQSAVLAFQRWVYFARYGLCPKSWGRLDHELWESISECVRFQNFIKGDKKLTRKGFPITMLIFKACIRTGICPNDFLFQASYYRKPARVPFFGIGQAVELGEDRYLAQLLYRDRKNVKNVVPVGDRDTKENLEMAIMLQVYSFFSIKDMDSKWKHWKVRNMPKVESYTYLRNLESKATVAELKAGILLESKKMDKNGFMFRKNEDVENVAIERPGTPAPGAEREQLDGVVFDPVYSGRVIYRSRYDFSGDEEVEEGTELESGNYDGEF